MKDLFTTCVGSQMWQMQRPDSDIDLFTAYEVPSTDILLGHKLNSHQSIGNEIDKTSHEIGIIVNQLIKGNVNFIWGVHSPIVINDSPILQELKIITEKPSANCHNSIRGLAVHNYKQYIENEVNPSQKRLKTVMRTLRFGIGIMEGKGYRFEPVVEDLTKQDILTAMRELDEAFDNTHLHYEPDWQGVLMEWLLRLRLKDLDEQRAAIYFHKVGL